VAIKYWESLLQEEAFNIKEQTFRQDTMAKQVHSCKLDKGWTRAGIERGISEVNKDLAKKGQPLIDLSKNRITRAVNIFHREVAKAKGKRITPIGPDRFGEFQYPKRVLAGPGSKKSNEGKIFHATEDLIVADNGNSITRILTSARSKMKDYLVAKEGSGVKDVVAKSGLAFAHGEAGNSKSTLGALGIGESVLNKANSIDGEVGLMETFKGNNAPLDNLQNIKEWGVGNLRDFIYNDLRIKMRINEHEQGDTVSFSDEFVIETAFKIQDDRFASLYDSKSRSVITGELKGIKKTFLETQKKAFLKRFSRGDITKLEYESSPKGKTRAKNATIRQMEKSFNAFLKKNPQFTVLAHGGVKVNKKATTKPVNVTGKKVGRPTTKKGRKARAASKVAVTTKPQSLNPLALKELINAQLPQELLEQMGSPALVNRTGRFRQSARATNALVGPQGGVEIEYTYQLNPYQTFEPGGAMGSTARDPRRLIGNTIREIAQKIMGKRFIKTRRV
jgi:hypothetical protein